MESVAPLIGLSLALAGAVGLFVLGRWRWALAALGVQSLGAGLMALSIVAVPIALVQISTGWLVGGILALTLRRERLSDVESSVIPPGWLFRTLLALLIAMAALALLPDLGKALNDPPPMVAFVAVNLIAYGLFGLGLNDQPLRTGVSLVTVLQGFTLAYLWSERSLLVIALLAAVNVTITLSVVYLDAVTRAHAGEDAPA